MSMEAFLDMSMDPFIDEFGQVRNAPGLPEALAAQLLKSRPVLFSWCDNHDTRLTVLLAVPYKLGMIPGLAGRILYVAVEGFGSYGFAIRDEDLHPDYIAEKLGRKHAGTPANPTWQALAELVGPLRMALAKAVA